MNNPVKITIYGIFASMSIAVFAYNNNDVNSKNLHSVKQADDIQQPTANVAGGVLSLPKTSTSGPSEFARLVNRATWSQVDESNSAGKAELQTSQSANIESNESSAAPEENIKSKALGIRLQALLNWNNASPGPVDGLWGSNTKKALKSYQAMIGTEQTGELSEELWNQLLMNNEDKPVLVNYRITDADISTKLAQIPTTAQQKSELEGMYYESLAEALAEKFHMHIDLFKSLNGTSFKAGDVITVYNIGQPNLESIDRLVANKKEETLYAYNQGKLVATYPTTVGNTKEPSPSGSHTITVKVHEPTYTYTNDSGKRYILPPGPNSPVGNVWLGLSKDGYGIHGSPNPEGISRQTSAGCIRLTNWDALTLYRVIEKGATVEFK